uniref:Succinylglutamate desuccinylase n=1 Tax=Vibrio algicola TaxID=2662262 RepID=A0A5Q0TI36_9VIBR|nr:succinylglutamate desuccinylase [Vibrio algicola]
MFDFLAESLAGDDISSASGTIKSSASSINWHRPDTGIIVFEPTQDVSGKPDLEHSIDKDVVISCAIHGNETAPVEIVSELVQGLLTGQYPLKVRLMVILGNLNAMRLGERYIDIDLNRLFCGAHANHSSNLETLRAEKLEQQVGEFYQAEPQHSRWHFDLHTAIKPSRHIRFGLLPFVESGQYCPSIMNWLQSVGLEALVINHAPASTFSYFTSHLFNAESCTLELGKALPFGSNDLSQFEGIRNGLIHLINNNFSSTNPDQKAAPIIYKVAQQLTKVTDQFRFNINENSHNFTEFKQGTLLASDQNTLYMVKENAEYLLFPNSKVKTGFRAGLMLKRVDTLKHLLIKGEKSGIADHDFDSFINELDSEQQKENLSD